ncbi:MAG TPA: type I 3-dehydroquinate dehydratase [Tepidisphaeraceae bacterium]|nr:type I 3-dehydroquinate dehydratase [Tepidisphaeraceae bacterium]
MTHLCVPIFVNDLAQARRDIATAAEAGADMVEIRIDGFDADPTDLISKTAVPTVVTCRAAYEGGREGEQSDDSDQDRFDRLTNVAGSASYIDIELEAIDGAMPKRPTDSLGPRLIVSSHDFQGRPDNLYNILERLNQSFSTVNKIVWTARSIRDNIEAFEILQSRQKPTIALCMGEAGLLSRVLAKKFGAFLTFASLSSETGTAPGQVTIHDFKRLYRWDAIGPETKVYGVVACPIAHSMSPAIHNAAFDKTGEDGVYLPMLVQPGYESFKAFMEEFTNFKPLHLRGLSVTIPHKENALKYLQEKGARIEPLAVTIGAVNTIIIDRDSDGNPILRGINTDYQAIIETICAPLGIQQEQLADYRVAVIGAGGTGRTAVAALAQLGATVVVYNRTKERADALAAEFNNKVGRVVSARMEKLCDSCCHIYINTTSVGMHPKIDESPLGDRTPNFTSDTLVFDTIYNPPLTRLLQQAQQAGAKIVGGIEMFVRQAAAQFVAWTDKPAPAEIMRAVVEQRLKNQIK